FWAVAAVEHGVDDAAVDGFQTVSDVGQCTSHDDGHGVVEVRPFHFGLEVDLVYAGSRYFGFGGGLLVTHGFVISEFVSKLLKGYVVGLRCRGSARLWRCPGWSSGGTRRRRPSAWKRPGRQLRRRPW